MKSIACSCRFTRLVGLLDLDAFYAQVKERNDPSMRGVPMAVTQKYIIVTSNYEARAAGVKKMQPIQDALLQCPILKLCNGEDLTEFRDASETIEDFLNAYHPGIIVERGGLDEFYLDVTELVDGRLAPLGDASLSASLTPALTLEDMEKIGLVVGSPSLLAMCSDDVKCDSSALQKERQMQRLFHAFDILCQISSELHKTHGFRVSIGVSTSKALAKIACPMNKPMGHTLFLPSALQTDAFLDLPARSLPGVGYKMYRALKQLCFPDFTSEQLKQSVVSIRELQSFHLASLCQCLGEKVGQWLYPLARGWDGAPVRSKGFSKNVGVEESFHSMRSTAHLLQVLLLLSQHLVRRLQTERERRGRIPGTLCVSIRRRGMYHRRTSRQCDFPVAGRKLDPVQAAEAVYATSLSVLQKLLSEHVETCDGKPSKGSIELLRAGGRESDVSLEQLEVVVLNLSASNFQIDAAAAAAVAASGLSNAATVASERPISSFMDGGVQHSQPTLHTVRGAGSASVEDEMAVGHSGQKRLLYGRSPTKTKTTSTSRPPSPANSGAASASQDARPVNKRRCLDVAGRDAKSDTAKATSLSGSGSQVASRTARDIDNFFGLG